MNLTLTRKQASDKCIIGNLAIDGMAYCSTLELPWRDNEHGVSCIPEGEYPIVIDWSMTKQEYLPHVLDVPERDGIRIHPGNTARDTEGCILVGRTYGIDVVMDSRKAFGPLYEKIKAALATGGVILTVTSEIESPKRSRTTGGTK